MNNVNPLGLDKALSFFKFWRQEMAYTLGLLYADGCVTTHPNRRGYYEVNIELKDVDYLRTVAKIIDPKLRVHEYSRIDGRHSARLSIGVKEIVNDCVALGLRPRKSLDIEWPATLPEVYEADFVRGYFDAD